eukprot:scaffold219516_cov31-Tisochrysis_lutea.AAC.4
MQVHFLLSELFGEGAAHHGRRDGNGKPLIPAASGSVPQVPIMNSSGTGSMSGPAYFRFNPVVPRWAQAKMDETSPEVLDRWVEIGRQHVTSGRGADDMAELARRLTDGMPDMALRTSAPADFGARSPGVRGVGGWLAPAWWSTAARDLMKQWLAKRPLRVVPFGRSRL